MADIPDTLSPDHEKETARVLIVSGRTANVASLGDMVSECGYSLVTAGNGTEALEQASEAAPDLILLDISIPGTDWIAACKKLKQNAATRNIPILIITAGIDKELKIECLQAGASDFIEKPFYPAEFLARAGNLIRLKELENVNSRNLFLATTIREIEKAKKEWVQALDCIDDMVILTDASNAVRRCNKASREFFGESYKMIVGRDWRELFLRHGLDIDLSGTQGGEIFHQATEKWFTVNFYPIMSSGGETSGTVISIRDFTALKMITEALSITNEAMDKERGELRFALDEISSLIQQVVNEKDSSIRFRNPNLQSCREITHCDKKECPCYDKKEVRCWQVAGTYCGSKVQGSFAKKIENCAECSVFKFATSDPIYKIGEYFNNMMHILETQNKELEQAYSELKTVQSQILQQEKMASIGQLAAGVAHEINNPTGFIMSNLGSLQKYAAKLSEFVKAQSDAIAALSAGDDSGNVLEQIEEHRRSLKVDYITGDVGNLIKESLDGAERIKKIVQDLKNFSRIDEAELKVADINAGLESTINIVWNELKYKATVKKEYGDIPMLLCNPGQLNQVFMNMLVNAANAIEKQGEITVKTWHKDDFIHISISDTGCGIPEDKLGRVFEPFFTTKEVGKGTGLGLSIAYDIVKKHKGQIKVDSEVGKGTTFSVEIPIQSK